MFRRTVHKNWMWIDMVVDMLWNILSIGPRVYYLLASYEVHWFWSFAGTHVVVMTGMIYFLDRGGKTRDVSVILYYMLLATMVGLGWLFSICLNVKETVHFRFYLFNWLIVFLENTMIYMCFVDPLYPKGLYVMLMCAMSLIVECLHAYFYNGRKRVTKICQ